MNIIWYVIVGFAAGIIGGAFGVGGGFILVPIFIYVFRQDMHTAVGTSLAVIIPMALVSASRHAYAGNVNIRLAAIITVGAVVGGFAGAYLSPYCSNIFLRRAFALLLLVAAVRMFLK